MSIAEKHATQDVTCEEQSGVPVVSHLHYYKNKHQEWVFRSEMKMRFEGY